MQQGLKNSYIEISLYKYSSVWNNLYLIVPNFPFFQKFSQEPHPGAIINIFSIYFDIMRKSEIFRADFSRPDVQPTGWMRQNFEEIRISIKVKVKQKVENDQLGPFFQLLDNAWENSFGNEVVTHNRVWMYVLHKNWKKPSMQ